MKQRDFTSATAKEALLKDKEDKCCGNCCWFYGEMTDGEGFCALRDSSINETRYDFLCAYELHVSCQEMRHHMAVLLKEKRWQKRTSGWRNGEIFFPPEREDVIKAIDFAYRYMKVFSKL